MAGTEQSDFSFMHRDGAVTFASRVGARFDEPLTLVSTKRNFSLSSEHPSLSPTIESATQGSPIDHSERPEEDKCVCLIPQGGDQQALADAHPPYRPRSGPLGHAPGTRQALPRDLQTMREDRLLLRIIAREGVLQPHASRGLRQGHRDTVFQA